MTNGAAWCPTSMDERTFTTHNSSLTTTKRKFCMNGFLLCGIGGSLVLCQSLHGQDLLRSDTEAFDRELSETMADQRKSLLSGLDSLISLRHGDLSILENVETAEDSVICRRMHGMQRGVPLGYNKKIRSYITKYVSRNYNPYMGRLRGLGRHYFPIFEKILAENGLPDEIKYISVVESSLNPNLVSSAGAVGLWQFMYPTAKIYHLAMDGQMDERKDPYAACHAASRYFREAYEEFGDWLLAMASYNCGRGRVRRAIQRSGLEAPSFWELSPHLPLETRNYIPKFIAMAYALEHADEYGIGIAETHLAWESEAVMLDRRVSLQRVAEALDIPLEILRKFNPFYKGTLVNASPKSPKRLIVPLTPQRSDSLLYAAIHHPLPARTQTDVRTSLAGSTGNSYKVKKGETLATVSKKFGVSVQKLKAWNDLTSKSRIVGRTLLISDARLAMDNERI